MNLGGEIFILDSNEQNYLILDVGEKIFSALNKEEKYK